MAQEQAEPLGGAFERARAAWPEFGAGVVLDVGANVGQSYRAFRAQLPEAEIHCFEPAPETFPRLQAAARGDARAVLNRAGLAARAGRLDFTTGHGTDNHLVARPEDMTGDVVPVEITTGDAYCAKHAIARVDFLKIDTEGHDLAVLAGFSGMLRQGRIDLLAVEATTSLDNRFHVHLERFIHFLHPFGYRLTELVEPVRRVNRTRQELNGIWFCNAVFVREVENPRLRRDGIN